MFRGRGKTNWQGFTIVELLIVVVVIAILAAITVVAYNGITASANDSRIRADAKSLEKILAMQHVERGDYYDGSNTDPETTEEITKRFGLQPLSDRIDFLEETYNAPEDFDKSKIYVTIALDCPGGFISESYTCSTAMITSQIMLAYWSHSDNAWYEYGLWGDSTSIEPRLTDYEDGPLRVLANDM